MLGPKALPNDLEYSLDYSFLANLVDYIRP